ncbi:MAG: pyrroline-5-carboxylate reductase [Sphingomicrobium sp.]
MHFPTPTWLVGCGNMTGAMVEGWRASGVDFSGVVVIRPSGTAVDGIRTVRSPAEAGSPPQLVILGFKPQQLEAVAPQLAPYLSAKTILVSLLAGADVANLRTRFPGVGAVVRAMPNLPVSVRRGVTALHSEDADAATRDLVGRVMGPLGLGFWAIDEKAFGVSGAVAGSGPAYVARFIAALETVAVERGLDPTLARSIAIETVFGSAWLAASDTEPLTELARKVASPGGTTEAALAVLDSEEGMTALLRRAVEAADQRGSALREEVRKS